MHKRALLTHDADHSAGASHSIMKVSLMCCLIHYRYPPWHQDRGVHRCDEELSRLHKTGPGSQRRTVP